MSLTPWLVPIELVHVYKVKSIVQQFDPIFNQTKIRRRIFMRPWTPYIVNNQDIFDGTDPGPQYTYYNPYRGRTIDIYRTVKGGKRFIWNWNRNERKNERKTE